MMPVPPLRGLGLHGLATLVLLLVLLPGTLRAAADNGVDAMLQGWDNTLDQVEAEITSSAVDEARFEAIRATLQDIIDQAKAAAEAARGTTAVTQQMLDALGAPPAEGEPAEAEVIAGERRRLGDSLATFDAQARRAELAATRAGILLRTVNAQRMQLFTDRLLQRAPGPLEPSTWDEVPVEAQYIYTQLFANDVMRPLRTLDWETRGLLILAGVAAFAVGLPVRRWLRRRYGQQRPVAEPSYRDRVVAAVAGAVRMGLLPALAVLFVLTALMAALGNEPYLPVLRPFVQAASAGLVFFCFVRGLAHALYAPDYPRWRLADVTDEAARPLTHRMVWLAAALSLSGAVMMILDRIIVPPDFFSVVFFAVTLLIALALIAVLQGRLWRQRSPVPPAVADPAAPGAAMPGATMPVAAMPTAAIPAVAPGSVPLSDGTPPAEGEAAAAKGGWPKLRLLALLLALLAIVASGLGYQNLTRYVGQLFFAGVLLGGVVLVARGLVREGLDYFCDAKAGRVAQWRKTLFPRERGLHFFHYLALALADICFFLLWLLLLMPVSGMSWTEVGTWGRAILDGVTIGGVVLKPADILLALLAFVLAVMITRFIQRRLDDRVLSKLQMDRGVRNSINTGIGYLGIILAILIGIGTLGLDLSNLALIASALSVGIGFGLQNVVQNFVAGLILLVERPIKVGDWVVVAGNQGIVKRISVRATEIQTFQRSSLIVPNAEFVSSAVVNWTHKDKVGVTTVSVSVEHGTDLKQLRELLLECAQESPLVLRFPAPGVIFKSFGPSSLDFDVSMFVADVDNMGKVASDLRFRLLERFAELGIRISQTQQVVQIPQLDDVREVLSEARALRDELRRLAGPSPGEAGGAAQPSA